MPCCSPATRSFKYSSPGFLRRGWFARNGDTHERNAERAEAMLHGVTESKGVSENLQRGLLLSSWESVESRLLLQGSDPCGFGRQDRKQGVVAGGVWPTKGRCRSRRAEKAEGTKFRGSHIRIDTRGGWVGRWGGSRILLERVEQGPWGQPRFPHASVD